MIAIFVVLSLGLTKSFKKKACVLHVVHTKVVFPIVYNDNSRWSKVLILTRTVSRWEFFIPRWRDEATQPTSPSCAVLFNEIIIQSTFPRQGTTLVDISFSFLLTVKVKSRSWCVCYRNNISHQ